ncbi:hypothetical protein K466DRAFT_304922 [Polyporus arcularius HHB13444]|uniref:Uncharacterized protein n=1 Tax=Polyporus arcularius HHB13444 TaxID=1314778 RepID=A0A5C3NXZ1_9APHY|nr:hypothetical protein K466DRAFT_304922 [Polyporus arcularius HHB13444]
MRLVVCEGCGEGCVECRCLYSLSCLSQARRPCTSSPTYGQPSDIGAGIYFAPFFDIPAHVGGPLFTVRAPLAPPVISPSASRPRPSSTRPHSSSPPQNSRLPHTFVPSRVSVAKCDSASATKQDRASQQQPSKPQATLLTKLYAFLTPRESPHDSLGPRRRADHRRAARRAVLHFLPCVYRQSRFASFSRQLNDPRLHAQGQSSQRGPGNRRPTRAPGPTQPSIGTRLLRSSPTSSGASLLVSPSLASWTTR